MNQSFLIYSPYKWIGQVFPFLCAYAATLSLSVVPIASTS